MRSLTTQDIQGAQPKKQVILPRSRQYNNSNASSINLSTGEQIMAIPASPLKNIQNLKDITANNSYAVQAVIAQPNNDFLQQQVSPSNHQPISRIKSGFPQVDSIRALFASEGSIFNSSNNKDVRQINLNMANNNSNLNLNYKTIGTSSGEFEDGNRMQGVIKTNPDEKGRQSFQANLSNERPRNSNITQSVKNSTRSNGLFEGAQRMRSDLDRSQQESQSQQHSAGRLYLAQKPWEQVPIPDGNDSNGAQVEMPNNQPNNSTNPRLSNNSQVSSSRLPVQQGVINLFEQKLRNSSQNSINNNHGNYQQLAYATGQLLSNSAVSYELQKIQNSMSKSAAPMTSQNLTEQDLAVKRKTDDFTSRQQRENFHHTNTNSITSSNVIPDQEDGLNQQQNGGFYGDTSPKISLIPVEMPRLLSEGKKIVEKRTPGSRQTNCNSNTNRLRSPQDSLRQKLAQLTSNIIENGNAAAVGNGDKKDNKKQEKLGIQQQQLNSPSWQSTAKEHRIIVLCESSNLTREWIHRFFGMRNISNYEVFSFPGGPGCLVLSGDDSERGSWRTVLGIFIKNLSKVYQIQEIHVFMNTTSIFSQIYGKDEGKNTVLSLSENLRLACSYIKDTQNALTVKGFAINQKGIIDKIV